MLAGWGESGRIGLRNVHIWAPPPYLLPNLIVQSIEPNPLPGSFAFIENYSELTLRLGRICKWANLTKKTHRRVQERIFHHVSCATAAPANPALYHQCPPDRRGVRRAPLMQRWGMKPR